MAKVEPLVNSRLNSRLADTMTELSGLYEALEQSEKVTSGHFKDLESSVTKITRKSLDDFFEEWKQGALGTDLKQANELTLREFKDRPENRKILAECEESLKKMVEKARIWSSGLTRWTSDLATAPESQGSPFFASFAQRYGEYCARCQKHLAEIQSVRSKCEVATVPADPGEGLSFLDVVTGRSGEKITRGYQLRLATQLQEVVESTQQSQQNWDRLRTEVLELLDEFYGHLDSLAGHGMPDQGTKLLPNLRSALGEAKIVEVPVEMNRTPYDPSVHEPLAGARLTRPDLPENTVVRIDCRGFFYEGKVLRRALVTLSSKGPL